MIQSIDPLSDPRWPRLVEQFGGGLFHSVPWLRAVAETYGFDIRAAVACDDAKQPVAGVPYCELDDCTGRRVVSLPFTDACDPLGISQGVDEAIGWLQSHGVPVQLRLLDAAGASWTTRLEVAKRARWHRLKIACLDTLWQAMTPAMRRGVRKAERAGVVARIMDGERAAADFLVLHASVRKRKYRLLAQPLRFFESIQNQFAPSGGWLPLGAYLKDRLIAVTVFLLWDGVLYYKFNASAEDALGARPNNLLVWEGIKMAQALGCHTLDLGPSDGNQPGLIRFKRDTGAIESELVFLRWNPDGWQDAHGAEVRQLLGELTAILTDPSVPDDLAIRAGAKLYRYFA